MSSNIRCHKGINVVDTRSTKIHLACLALSIAQTGLIKSNQQLPTTITIIHYASSPSFETPPRLPMLI
jgi:hypothetical protein